MAIYDVPHRLLIGEEVPRSECHAYLAQTRVQNDYILAIAVQSTLLIESFHDDTKFFQLSELGVQIITDFCTEIVCE